MVMAAIVSPCVSWAAVSNFQFKRGRARVKVSREDSGSKVSFLPFVRIEWRVTRIRDADARGA